MRPYVVVEEAVVVVGVAIASFFLLVPRHGASQTRGAEATKGDPHRAEQAAYQRALIAAVQQFAHNGELKHLKAVIGRHPDLLDARQSFRQPHKPGPYDQYTPLHYAVGGERLEVVQFLLAAGADLEADSGNGWTPLHLAVRNGNLNMVTLFVEKGANLDAQTNFRPAQASPGGPVDEPPDINPAVPPMTPLQVAKKNDHEEIAKYLEIKMRERRRPGRK